jgi:hypothetical protein
MELPDADEMATAHRLATEIGELLNGQNGDVIGLALGEVTAMWLSAHRSDDPTERCSLAITTEVQADVLKAQVRLIKRLAAVFNRDLLR